MTRAPGLWGAAIGLSLLSAALLHAEPPWQGLVNTEDLNEAARSHWERAADLWDHVDFAGSLAALGSAAETQPDHATLWLALATGAVESAGRRLSRDAMDCLETAERALSRLEETRGLPRSVTMRVEALRRTLDERRREVMVHQIALQTNPMPLEGLGSGLDTLSRPEMGFEGSPSGRINPQFFSSSGRSGRRDTFTVDLDIEVDTFGFPNQFGRSQPVDISIGVR